MRNEVVNGMKGEDETVVTVLPPAVVDLHITTSEALG